MQGTKYKLPSPSRNSKRKQGSEALPTIPDKRYFTIGEVGALCGVKPHVLRYWEQEFTHIDPIKRRGNRRYYQYKDVMIIRQVRKLLYEDGFTIEGARAQLNVNSAEVSKSVQKDAVVKKIIADLELILQKLKMENIS
ncbi:MAG: MerR family transcriptional regulator [Gammaproteobacteria bacterium]